jgi:crossover junction endodeoxyribonuclease RusA
MTVTSLDFIVEGKPEPQGSVRAFVPQKDGKPMRRGDGSVIVNLTSDNPALKRWRQSVGAAALPLRPTVHERGVAVAVEVTFFLARPLNQMGTGRNAGVVKDHAPAAPVVLPDVDKLARATLDALTGVCFEDDSQVVELTARKRYASGEPWTRIVVRRCEVQTALEAAPPQLALA